MSESIFTSQTPSGSFSDAAPGLTLGTLFTASVDGQITGIRWYFPSTLPASAVGLLYSYTTDTTGSELARATFVSPTAGTWNTVNFASPVNITAGTLYVAAVLTPDWYVATSGLFASSGITNGHLTAIANDVITPNTNGKFHVGATAAFPEQTFGASCYFADVLFTVGTGTVNVDETDTATATDAVSIAASGALTDAGTVTDAPAVAMQSGQTETGTIGDTLTLSIASALTDIGTITDSFTIAILGPQRDIDFIIGAPEVAWHAAPPQVAWTAGTPEV
jgi:hypothetical protein